MSEERAGDCEGDRAPNVCSLRQSCFPGVCSFVSFIVGFCWFCPESGHLLCFSVCPLSQHRGVRVLRPLGDVGTSLGAPGCPGSRAQRLLERQRPCILNLRRDQRHVPHSRARPCLFCAFPGRGTLHSRRHHAPPIPRFQPGYRAERPGFEPSQHLGQVRPQVSCELSVLICETRVTIGLFFFFCKMILG